MSRFLALFLTLSTALALPNPFPVPQEEPTDPVDPSGIYNLHAIQFGTRIGCLSPFFTIITDLTSCAQFAITVYPPYDNTYNMYAGSVVDLCGYQKEAKEGVEVEKYRLWCGKDEKERSGMFVSLPLPLS
jgi:hypothetical protein